MAAMLLECAVVSHWPQLELRSTSGVSEQRCEQDAKYKLSFDMLSCDFTPMLQPRVPAWLSGYMTRLAFRRLSLDVSLAL